MKRLAFLSPLPPARTGVAHYASMLLPALKERAKVTAFDAGAMDRYDPSRFDVAVYQLGNNPQHEFVYRQAMRTPGVAVLHDVVLHHLIVEMTLARGDEDAYVAAMRANHGEMGAAWARGRAIGLHDELANFLMPASIEVANRSRAVIVHNRYAAGRLRDLGVITPIHIVPHPYVPDSTRYDRTAIREKLGYAKSDRIIGLFGFLTSAKRAEVVLEAFRMARQANSALQLLIVGDPAPNISLDGLRGEGVKVTGYVDDAEFGAFYAASDRLVNLRYPSAGESSGTLVRAFEAGKPVAVSDYAQFAELPADCVVKIPFGPEETSRLAEFFLRDLDSAAIATAQRRWLEANARLDLAADGYMNAIAAATGSERGAPPASSPGTGASLALFPNIAIARVARNGDELAITLRNDGPDTIRAVEYGQPAYRAVLKIFDGDREVLDRWMALPKDLRPGDETVVTLALDRQQSSERPRALRLYHALESIPVVAERPASEVEIPVVR